MFLSKKFESLFALERLLKVPWNANEFANEIESLPAVELHLRQQQDR